MHPGARLCSELRKFKGEGVVQSDEGERQDKMMMITFHNKVNQTFISSLPNKWLTIPTKGGEAADRGAAEQLPQGRV